MTPDPLRVTEEIDLLAGDLRAQAFTQRLQERSELADWLDHRADRLSEVLAVLPLLVPKPEDPGPEFPHWHWRRRRNQSFGYWESSAIGLDENGRPAWSPYSTRPKPEGVEGDPLEWAWELLEKAGYPEAALEARDAWRPYRDRQREAGRE